MIDMNEFAEILYRTTSAFVFTILMALGAFYAIEDISTAAFFLAGLAMFAALLGE